jgi:hypothetical protein
MVDGYLWGKRMVTMTANELANALLADKLTRTIGDIRLLVCWGGYVGSSVADWNGEGTLKRKQTDAPFAGQLCGALKSLGYDRVMVTGYKGSVLYNTQNPCRNLAVSGSDGHLLANPEPLGSSMRPTTLDQLSLGCKVFSLDSATRTVWR